MWSVQLPPDLDITISTVVVNCNELRVTVEGSQGVGPYEYTFSDNPVTFNPGTATWVEDELIEKILHFLGSESLSNEIGSKAKGAILASRGATERTLSKFAPFLS